MLRWLAMIEIIETGERVYGSHSENFRKPFAEQVIANVCSVLALTDANTNSTIVLF
jgi:hypothetical protein